MPACRHFDSSEISAMLSGFTGRRAARNRAFFLMGIFTGFRVSELCALTLGDVVSGGKIRDSVTVARARMKGRRAARTVPINPTLRRHLHAAVDDLHKRGFFARGTPLFRIGRSYAYRILRSCADSRDIRGRIGTHSLRKTFAHNIYQGFLRRRAAGEYLDPLLETSRALGHATVQNTVDYLPANAAMIHDAIKSLERLLQ